MEADYDPGGMENLNVARFSCESVHDVRIAIVKDTVRNFTARPEIAVSWCGLTAGHPVSPCQVRETFRESRCGALSGG